MSRKIEIILAHEANICAAALKALLDEEGNFAVVGSTDNVGDMLPLVEALVPHVVVCDLRIGRESSIPTIRTICTQRLDTRVLVLSMDKTSEHVHAALQAGASGYVLKDAPAPELFEGVRAAASGRSFLGSGLPVKLFRDSVPPAQVPVYLRRLACDRLTMREHEVLLLVADGRSSNEIADTLSLSAKTIAKHRANLMRKLDLHNVASLTRFAHEIGLFAGSRTAALTDDGFDLRRNSSPG